MRCRRLSENSAGISRVMTFDLLANPSGLAIFLCPPFGQPFGVGHFFMSVARDQFSSSGARYAATFGAAAPNETSSLAAVRAMHRPSADC